MSSDNRSADELREIALGILEHAKNDAEYLDNLKNDPEAVLSASGLSADESRQLVGEFNLDDVQGYLFEQECQYTCNYSCNTGTCQYTYCSYFPATGGPMETR